jgi:methyl-accepting chemotaxis protein
MKLLSVAKISCACIGVGVVLLILSNKYYSSTIKIGGNLDRQILLSENLVASIQPGPENVIEAYLEATLLKDAPHPLPERQAHLLQLKHAFDERHEYWSKQNIEAGLKALLNEQSYEPAVRYWAILEKDFIPAVEEGNSQQADDAYRLMSEAYREHRKWLDETVRQARARNEYLHKYAASAVDDDELAYVSLSTIVLILVGLSIVGLLRGLLAPLSRLKAVICSLADGKSQQIIPFLARRDEIGVVARSLEMLRRGAVEHASLRNSMGEAAKKEADRERVVREQAKELSSAIASAVTTLKSAAQDYEPGNIEVARSLDRICEDLSKATAQFQKVVSSSQSETALTGQDMSLMITIIRDGGSAETVVEEVTPTNIRIKPVPGLALDEALKVDLGFGPLSACVAAIENGHADLILTNRADGIYLGQ